MHRSLRFLAAVFLSVVSVSCVDPSSPASGGTVTMRSTYDQFMIPLFGFVNVPVYGGKGSAVIASIGDSSLVDAVPGSRRRPDGSVARWVEVSGKRAGRTTITVRDSAHTAAMVLTAIVSEVAADPMTVSVMPGWSEYVTLSGGTEPYTVEKGTDNAVAEMSLSAPFVITGVRPGTTSFTVKDAAVPPHRVTIPVTVSSQSTPSDPGTLSFTSSHGTISMSGLLLGEDGMERTEGAGAILHSPSNQDDALNRMEMYSYRTRPNGNEDYCVLRMETSQPLLPRVFPVTTNLYFPMDSVSVSCYFDVHVGGIAESDTEWVLTSGYTVFTALSTTRVTGTFFGSGVGIDRYGRPLPGTTFTMTDGAFDMPVFYANASSGGRTLPERVAHIVKRMEQERTSQVRH